MPGLSRPTTIIVLSDFHAGSHANDRERLAAIFNEVRARSCDMVFVLGDVVNVQPFGGGRIRPEVTAELLAPLASEKPTIAVLGNHDIEYGRGDVAKSLMAVGIDVLRNKSRRVAGLMVAGVDDYATGDPDIERTLRDIPEDEPVALLAHDPASFGTFTRRKVITFSGHTHGGQICLPIIGPIVNASTAPLRWTRGHIVEDGRHLVVSAGLGTSGLPFRFNCPPEVVEVILRP